jgi:hypothetical protein
MMLSTRRRLFPGRSVRQPRGAPCPGLMRQVGNVCSEPGDEGLPFLRGPEGVRMR